jgi:hypothetical protein
MWGALSDERTGLSFATVTVSSNKSVVSMYNLHFTCKYMQHTHGLSVQAQHSRSCPVIRVNGSSVHGFLNSLARIHGNCWLLVRICGNLC